MEIHEVHNYLLGGVAPRPIALVSTKSVDGVSNLSPFSFYNAFGANPPTVAFSASRRVRDNTVKDTYNNLIATRECVIQAVTYEIVQQVSLTSTEFETGINEFIKAGLTEKKSDLVKPSRVAESPFQMECRLIQMLPLGNGPGSGNLAICEVIKFHINEKILRDGVIHPDKIDLVSRMGADYYNHAVGKSVFRVKKPGPATVIGYDQLPEFIKYSDILSGNNLGQLASALKLPSKVEVTKFKNEYPPLNQSQSDFDKYHGDSDYQSMFRVAISLIMKDQGKDNLIYITAQVALAFDNVDFAWKALLFSRQFKQRDK